VVLQIGHHYAFSFFDDAVEKHRVKYGQLSVLKDKHAVSRKPAGFEPEPDLTSSAQ